MQIGIFRGNTENWSLSNNTDHIIALQTHIAKKTRLLWWWWRMARNNIPAYSRRAWKHAKHGRRTHARSHLHQTHCTNTCTRIKLEWPKIANTNDSVHYRTFVFLVTHTNTHTQTLRHQTEQSRPQIRQTLFSTKDSPARAFSMWQQAAFRENWNPHSFCAEMNCRRRKLHLTGADRRFSFHICCLPTNCQFPLNTRTKHTYKLIPATHTHFFSTSLACSGQRKRPLR